MDNHKVNGNRAPILPMGDEEVGGAVSISALSLETMRHAALLDQVAKHSRSQMPGERKYPGASEPGEPVYSLKLERYREDKHGPCARMPRNREALTFLWPLWGG